MLNQTKKKKMKSRLLPCKKDRLICALIRGMNDGYIDTRLFLVAAAGE